MCVKEVQRYIRQIKINKNRNQNLSLDKVESTAKTFKKTWRVNLHC